MENEHFDVVVLGGGTGGYVAAIRASQLGLKTAIVEGDKLGGTCLHRGCIPSKSYLRSAELAHTASRLHPFGIVVPPPVIHWHKMRDRTDSIVQTLYQGVQGLVKKNRVRLIQGYGKLVGKEGDSWFLLSVNEETVKAKKVILATGSRPVAMGLPLDEERIMTSDQALQRRSLPKSVVIVGGGTIGMEWASLYNDLGVDVTVVESQERILAMEDADIAQEAGRLFAQRGIRAMTGATVRLSGIQSNAAGVKVPVADKDGREKVLEAEALLLSTGRQPNVENVYSDAFSFGLRGKHLHVDEFQRTDVDGVYAIGDVCGGGLAHVATRQGTIAAEHIAGATNVIPFDMKHVPKCTYTRPEIASVGLTEASAREAGREVEVGKYPFRNIGKSLVLGEHEGFAKVIADKENGEVLGVHLIGPHATELIAEPGAAMANDLSVDGWLKSTHAHPTLSEIFHEALRMIERK